MAHPASCTDPDCELRYAQHLQGLQFSPSATPSRAVNHTLGQPDEPMSAVVERQARWDREGAAFKVLRDAGVTAPTLESAPKLLRELGG